MREIKFRAWEEAHKLMWSWDMLNADDNRHHNLRIALNNEFGFTPMQYTGLKDKNGVEIYEGDIVAAKLYGGYIERIYWEGPPDVVGEVYWDLTGFRIKAHGEKDFRFTDFTDFADADDWDALVNMCESESEVIGNIYDNPELLESKA